MPSNFPTPGTETESNLPGEVTAPVSGWTYSWEAASKEFTVTAFSPEGKVVSVPTSTSVSGSGAGITARPTSTGGSTSTAPTTTSTSTSEGRRIGGGWGKALLVLLMQAGFFLL